MTEEERIKEKIMRIVPGKYEGSTMKRKEGVPRMYHDLPFREFDNLPTHRRGCLERVNRIKQYLDGIDGKIILDIGCSIGGISIGLAKEGAKRVIGVDYDNESLEVGREVARIKEISNVKLVHREITPEWIKKIDRYDVIIWLSHWQWAVKQYGLEKAKEMLFDASNKADIMIFESAANDGVAKIKGATQDDIEKWLLENTIYNRIRREPKFQGWSYNRDVFICTRPVARIESTRQAASSIIERIARDKIKKIYRECPKNCQWMQEREVKALKLLEKYDCFPKLLEEGDGYIIMNYIGRRLKGGLTFGGYKEQAYKILEALKEVGIIHRDINRKNFLHLNGKLYLIDFGWVVFREEDISKAKTHNNLSTMSDEENILRIFGEL